MSTPEDHYLRRELYARVRRDPAVFEFLQSGCLDGVWYWDLEQPEEEWMSPRFWTTFGHDPAEKAHLASEWQAMIHPDDLVAAVAAAQAHCADPTVPYDQVVRYTHSAGHTVWIRCRGIAIRDEQGVPVRMLGAHTDVTELVRAQQALADQAAQLARINGELDDFAYVAAHDLKEPLRAITNYVEFLLEDHRGELGEEALEMVGVIEDNARRMQERITALLDYARAGTGPSAAPRPLEAVVREAVDELGPTIAGHGAEVVLEGSWPAVQVVPTAIKEAIHNLVLNGIAYNESASKRVAIRCREDDEIAVEVADNGIGIDARHRERIFQPFRRLHPRDAFGGGTGMGLALVKKMIERAGGTIRVSSAVGGGSTFTFTLGDALRAGWPSVA